MSWRTTNILDDIHAELDPRVFEDPAAPEPTVMQTHVGWILGTVHRTLKDHGYTNSEDWLKLVLTGSLTTYQYSDESDCDVSLFVDAVKLPEWSRGEMIGIMTGNVDGTILPGTPHPMQCFVVARGITPKDLYRPGLRSGYDLNEESWIVPPERDRVFDVKAQMRDLYLKAVEAKDKMSRLLKYDPERAVMYWHQIHKRRMRDQTRGLGDFTESNIIYKELANAGLFPEISEASGEYIASIRPDALTPESGDNASEHHAKWDPRQWHLEQHDQPNLKTTPTRLVGMPWVPGYPGKALQDPYGNLVTWNVQSQGGAPYHFEMGAHGYRNPIGIQPDGTLDPKRSLLPEEYEPSTYDQIFLDEPRIRYGPPILQGQEDWRLASEPDFGNGEFSRLYERIAEEDGEELAEAFADYLAAHNEADRDSGELNDVPTEQVERWYENWESEGKPRTAAFKVPIVRKWVYDGDTDKLVVGEEGREEGEHPSHFQLAQSIGMDSFDNGLAGTISPAGWVAIEDGRAPWKVRVRAHDALLKAVPDIQGFLGGQATTPNLDPVSWTL